MVVSNLRRNYEKNNDEGLDTKKRVKFSVANSKVASAKFLCYEELVHLAAAAACQQIPKFLMATS